MALFAYQQQTQRLIKDGAQKDANLADLTGYINEARVQLAGESLSIRVMGTLAVVGANQGPYPFSAISLAGATGVAGILSVQTIWYQVGDGRQWIEPRPWPWFSLYEFNSPVLTPASPRMWTQYSQGVNGTLYFNLPDVDYTISVDTVCYPVPLVNDATVEAIPQPWTTAIPYYAAYLAYLAAQTGDKEAMADKMLDRYTQFVARGRKFSTPEILPQTYSQTGNVVRANQLGQTPGRGAGA